MKRIVAGLLLSFIGLGGLAIVALIAVRIHPPLAIFGLAVWRGHPSCSALESYHSAEQRMLQLETQRRIQPQFRQVGQDGRYRQWDTPDGRYWTADSNDAVLPILVAQQMSGIYRLPGPGRSARAGDVVIDCGAHIGTYVRRALAEGAARVVAIEPAPGNVECLRRNFPEQVASGSVVIRAAGVWDKQDKLTLYEDPQNSAAAGFVQPGQRHQASVEVPLTTIDQIVEELGLTKVDIIKMDIKGATVRALVGAGKTIPRFHPAIVLSTEEDGEDAAKLLELVRKIDSRYSLACTSCSLENWQIRPDVVVLQ